MKRRRFQAKCAGTNRTVRYREKRKQANDFITGLLETFGPFRKESIQDRRKCNRTGSVNYRGEDILSEAILIAPLAESLASPKSAFWHAFNRTP
jgi:hypothetical protein